MLYYSVHKKKTHNIKKDKDHLFVMSNNTNNKKKQAF